MSIQNVNIMGEGSISEGNYKKVTVMGNGRIIGDIEVENLSILGELAADANVKTEKMSVIGNGSFREVTAKEIGVTGSASYREPVKAEVVSVSGEAIFQESLKADTITVFGNLEVKGSAESEKFVSKGAFDIGTLNANNIKIKLYGKCRAEEIGGEEIEVIYPWYKKFLMDIADTLLFRRNRRASLHAETIEADRIYLENTIARIVRGSEIKIGPGCRIEKVEYRSNVYIDNSSAVEFSEKL